MHSSASISALQQRIAEMQPRRLDDRALPTTPGLRPLLPGGALRRGTHSTVEGSLLLALAFLAAPSRAGSWCGVVGCDTLGAEATAAAGVALDRCIFIPDPGDHAIGVAGALAEVLSVVVLVSPRRTPIRASASDTERMSARLREHGSALITLGAWPRSDTELRVTSSRWHGLGQGDGMLRSHDLTVESRDRRGMRHHTVRFADGAVLDPQSAAVHRLVPR